MQTSTIDKKSVKSLRTIYRIYWYTFLFFFCFKGGGLLGDHKDKAYLDLYLSLMVHVLIEVGLSEIQLSFMSASVERMWIAKDTGNCELFYI